MLIQYAPHFILPMIIYLIRSLIRGGIFIVLKFFSSFSFVRPSPSFPVR